MKKAVFLGCIVCVGLLLVACSSKGNEKSIELQKTSTVKSIQRKGSDSSVVDASDALLAEEFITIFINQSFDKEMLVQKEKRLVELAGDSSLDVAISDIRALKVELEAYQKTGQISTSASVTLVEREISSLTVYQNGALFFADVSYSEDSPAYVGSFDRRRQFTFKIEENKIIHFEEVIYK